MRTSRLLRFVGLPMVAAAMFSIAGGHWAVLQTVAWAGMLCDYSRHATVAQAVSDTFDGQHPCPLCCKVKEGQAKEQNLPATLQVEKKAEAFIAATASALPPPDAGTYAYPPLVDLLFTGRTDSPPSPVPLFLVS